MIELLLQCLLKSLSVIYLISISNGFLIYTKHLRKIFIWPFLLFCMEIIWLVASLLVVALAVALFKSQDLMFLLTLVKKYLFFILFLGVILFFSFSIYHINKSYDFDLTNLKGVFGAVKIYLSWLWGVAGNFGKITGYVINQDWVIRNSTIK